MGKTTSERSEHSCGYPKATDVETPREDSRSGLAFVVQRPAPPYAPKVKENGLYTELIPNVHTNTPNPSM